MSSPSTFIADRYRLVKLLGTGGMGVVWQAWDERLERPVAVKMLRTQPELTDNEREIATNRAMREARITAGLHHPHAVTVFDVVEHEGQPCIVMQLIESTPLSVLLREHGTRTPEATARIGAQVSSALAAAHKLRIVHRDVKPGNILVAEDGSAMISDFGISHALGDTTITATGMMHGTPAYLAPEVARGQPTSFASDVFSLGSTMYAMLEGTPPFGADNNALALLHKVARGGYPEPEHAGPLAPLLGRMLSADPKRRPSMKSVAARLSELAEGMDASAASDSPTVPMAGAAAETERLAGVAAFDAVVAPARNRPDPPPPARPAGHRGGPPPPPVEQAPEAQPNRRGRTAAMIGALVLAGILLLGGGAFLFGLLGQNPGSAGGPEARETPTETQAPDAATTPPATSEPQPAPVEPAPSADAVPEQPQPAPAPSPEQRIVESLTSYYAMLPGDLDSAWPLMTADYQQNHVGGRDAYGEFWGEITDVQVTDVQASPPDAAQATLTYTFADGRVVQEVTAYRLVDEGGVLKIAASEVLSSVGL